MSTEGKQSVALHHGESMCDVASNDYIRSCDRLNKLKRSSSLSCSFEHELSCDCPGGFHVNIACISIHIGSQIPVYRCLQSFATYITQDARPNIIVTLLTLSVKMGQRACSSLFCLYRQPIQWVCKTMTNSCFYCRTYMTSTHWRSVDADFNELFINSQLPSINASIIIWTYWLPFCLIETRPFGKAKPSNLLALVALISLQCIHLVKWFSLPAVLLFINQYSPVTAQYFLIIFL